MASLSDIKFVIINNAKYDVDGSAVNSLDEIKEVALEIEPGLSNAEPVQNGDTVTFTYHAGTKGAGITRVVYNNEVYNNSDPEADPKDIRDALAETYPELVNATWVVSGDTMTFRVAAGTKGC
jgi:PRTRC genetic system protein C